MSFEDGILRIERRLKAWVGDAPVHRRIFPRKYSGIASFIGTLAFLGLGAATIDQIQGIEGSLGLSAAASPFYYLGWIAVVLGLVLFFVSIDTIHFHPVWLFALAVPVEVYGWWNTWWTIIDLYACGGCNLPGGGVDLGTLGFGPIMVPLWIFLSTTEAAILVPAIVAYAAPRDVDLCPPTPTLFGNPK